MKIHKKNLFVCTRKSFQKKFRDTTYRKLLELGVNSHLNSISSLWAGLNVLSLKSETVIVDKHELPSIYKICDVVLFPSLYEGMDTISLEGMSCGIPVVCSNTSSFPEIAGNAALMCNPTDTIEITKNILKLF